MTTRYSETLLVAIHSAVERELNGDGMVNVPAVAQLVDALHPGEGGSIAEIEAQVMAVALSKDAVILFDRCPEGEEGESLAGPEGGRSA